MRSGLVALFALILTGCIAGPSGNADVPEPAQSVELPRYLGLWHEFARYENSFEKSCEGVTAEYAARADGKVSVKNTCRQGSPSGPIKVADGTATPAGDPKGAKFKVTFFGPALFTNYVVLDRAPDYSWAIVGEGSGRFLWILTREAAPSAARRDELLQRAKALGYDLSLLRFTKHRE
jgi:apolipoprotein D and lipocalin family protein